MERNARNAEAGFVLDLHHEDENGRCCIDESYREDAIQLCDAQKLNIDTREILFVVDKSGRAGRDPMEVFAIPRAMSDIIFQLTGYRFRFVLKIFASAMTHACESQYAATLYHTLMFLKRDAKTMKMVLAPRPEIREWKPLLPYLCEAGYGKDMPNVLETQLKGEDADDCNGSRTSNSEVQTGHVKG